MLASRKNGSLHVFSSARNVKWSVLVASMRVCCLLPCRVSTSNLIYKKKTVRRWFYPFTSRDVQEKKHWEAHCCTGVKIRVPRLNSYSVFILHSQPRRFSFNSIPRTVTSFVGVMRQQGGSVYAFFGLQVMTWILHSLPHTAPKFNGLDSAACIILPEHRSSSLTGWYLWTI